MIFLPLIFGFIVGSFLNSIIFRYNKGFSIIKERSKCFKCGHILSWKDLVPILSFLFLRGKCRYCKQKISLQYPLVEFFTGILFLFSWIVSKGDILEFLILSAIFSLLLIIFVIDLKNFIIPDRFSFSFIVLSGIYSFIFKSNFNIDIFLKDHLLAGFLYFLFFASLYLFSKGEVMGFGDAKLAFGIGLFLGVYFTFVSFLISFWIGGVFSLILIVVQKKGLKAKIPLGPFLITGFFTALMFDLLNYNFFFY